MSRYVPYDLALELKELGFNEKCFGAYIKRVKSEKAFELYESIPVAIDFLQNKAEHDDMQFLVKTPLWAEVFDWFEEKHKLHSTQDNLVMSYGIISGQNNDIKVIRLLSWEDTFKTKEEVRIERLKNLIDEVKRVH